MNWYRVTGQIKRVALWNAAELIPVNASVYAPDPDTAIRAVITKVRSDYPSGDYILWDDDPQSRLMTETDILATMPDLAPRLPGF